MANEDFELFPRGAIAMDNGDLIDVTNVKVTQKRGGKIIHTLRKQGRGKVLGNAETDVSFDAVCSETGPEKDYFALIKAGKVKKLRLKIPGETFTVIGTYDERTLELPLDDAIKYSLTFSGVTKT
jgi:hypothetical protein